MQDKNTRHAQLGENLTEKELLLAVYQTALRTQKLIKRNMIVGLIKVILIVAPFIFAIVYLPPYLDTVMERFADIISSLPQYPYPLPQ